MYGLRGLYGMPVPDIRRKVFISYHHKIDQFWFNEFTRLFGTHYQVFYDNSLDGRIRSDDPEYVNRRIREEHIFGTSITIVLCGPDTWKRKYVDWEIYSTLHHKHALLGVALPTAQKNSNNQVIVPDRLHGNIVSGYAHWCGWNEAPIMIKQVLEVAILKSSSNTKIKNDTDKMGRNLS